MFSTPSDAVLSSSFRYTAPHSFWGGFLWARMRLFEDRIEFAGLGWTGRHRRTLPLARIRDLQWRTGGGNVNFALYLHSSDENDAACIRVRVEAAGLWKHEVESRAHNLAPPEATLPDSQQPSPSPPHARAA